MDGLGLAITKPPAYLQRIQEVTTKPLQEKAVTAMEKDFAAFQQSMTALRQWYHCARCIDKTANYLQGIQAIAEQFKAGQPLSEAVHRAMWANLVGVSMCIIYSTVLHCFFG